MPELLLKKYLGAYPPRLLNQVLDLIQKESLGPYLACKYPAAHPIKNDKALYERAVSLKARFMKNAPPLDKVAFDPKIHVLQDMLGLHTTSFRQHGHRIKARREIRIASLFKDAPAAFLEMILVHELAHQKVSDHDKAFYQLCHRMLPEYGQLEFDLRLYLVHQEIRARGETPAPLEFSR